MRSLDQDGKNISVYVTLNYNHVQIWAVLASNNPVGGTDQKIFFAFFLNYYSFTLYRFSKKTKKKQNNLA